jgi:hypothetical protein
LGASNEYIEKMKEMCRSAEEKPSFVEATDFFGGSHFAGYTLKALVSSVTARNIY